MAKGVLNPLHPHLASGASQEEEEEVKKAMVNQLEPLGLPTSTVCTNRLGERAEK